MILYVCFIFKPQKIALTMMVKHKKCKHHIQKHIFDTTFCLYLVSTCDFNRQALASVSQHQDTMEVHEKLKVTICDRCVIFLNVLYESGFVLEQNDKKTRLFYILTDLDIFDGKKYKDRTKTQRKNLKSC